MPTEGTGRRQVTEVGRLVRVPKMAELIAADLRRRIIRGELAPGDVLPAEAVLRQRYAVSRSTLREAFRVLEAESLIEVRSGAGGGAHVRTPSLDVAARYTGLILEHGGTTVQDVSDARLMLEPPTAATLARRRTEDDLRLLREALAEHEGSTDPAEIVRLHNHFHMLVVRLAGNDTVALLIGMLSEIINRATWSRIRADLGTSAHERAERGTVKAHHALVELIEAQDAAHAEELWRRHLEAGGAYLVGREGDLTFLDLLG